MSEMKLKDGNEVPPPEGIRVAAEYRPDGSAEHLVADGENWVSLGKRYRRTPEYLVYSNFKTNDPEYVNWYLHHYVKCDLPTADRYNWRFSTSSRQGGGTRAGTIYIVPNWAELVAQAKIETRIFVEHFFRLVSLDPCVVEDDRVIVGLGAVRSNLHRADTFSLPLRYAGAPDRLADRWGEVLLQALRQFTEGLSGVAVDLYPTFRGLPPGFTPPPMRCKKWPVLMLDSSLEGVVKARFFEQIVPLAGLSGPEALAAIRDYGRWFEASFGDMRRRAFTKEVIGAGRTDPYYGVFHGVATGMRGFLSETKMM
ncbi:MAG: hypothetical protein JNK48_11155 [Bryobacterales bacterium]|nr:hypothetical protein [Bryobacterales bacterium]